MAIKRAVIELATANGGYLTREQLTASGVSASAVDRLVSHGDIRPVVAGVYQVVPSNDHADLIRGALLALPEAVASHHSAAHLLRLPKVPHLLPTVTVASHTTHRFPGVVVRRTDDLTDSHLAMVDDIRSTNVARTIFDLASVLPFRQFDRIAESAVMGERLALDQLESLSAELGRRGKPGTRAVRDFVKIRSMQPDASVLERKGRATLAMSGLQMPTPEFPLPWRESHRFDDAYPDSKVAIEWDSRTWHQSRQAMQNDRTRDREASSHGWIVLRFTWEDVTKRPSEVVSVVTNVLAQRQKERTQGSRPR